MKVSFEGAGEMLLSFLNASGASAAESGNLVKMSANNTVAVCADDDRFCGVCIHADSANADVQLKGYVELEYTGTAPTVGYSKLLASAAGKVKADSDGAEFLVLKVDTTNKIVGFIM